MARIKTSSGFTKAPESLRIYHSESVLEAALNRLRWLFDEFPVVICGVSGGKDSTVLFHLSLQVAREKNRLPLRVMFLDQEAEWLATRDMIKQWMYHPDVEPMWFQIPFQIFNATSSTDHWLHCWDENEKDKWVHPRDPIALTDNRYGTTRFHQLFGQILKTDFADTDACYVAGVRTEESPNRLAALTGAATYKGRTWALRLSKKGAAIGHYTFYPLYDWSFTDVWKYIHENNHPYNRNYDALYQYGVGVRDMRISNLHHETAVHSLFHLQEIEGDTYERLVARMAGIDMAAKMGKDDYFVKTLPFMFSDWREYRDYLLEHLIDPIHKKHFITKFNHADRKLAEFLGPTEYRRQIQAILANDFEGAKLDAIVSDPKFIGVKRFVEARNQEESAAHAQ